MNDDAMRTTFEHLAQTYIGLETIEVDDHEEVPEMKAIYIVRALRKAYEAGYAAATAEATK